MHPLHASFHISTYGYEETFFHVRKSGWLWTYFLKTTARWQYFHHYIGLHVTYKKTKLYDGVNYHFPTASTRNTLIDCFHLMDPKKDIRYFSKGHNNRKKKTHFNPWQNLREYSVSSNTITYNGWVKSFFEDYS